MLINSRDCFILKKLNCDKEIWVYYLKHLSNKKIIECIDSKKIIKKKFFNKNIYIDKNDLNIIHNIFCFYTKIYEINILKKLINKNKYNKIFNSTSTNSSGCYCIRNDECDYYDEINKLYY